MEQGEEIGIQLNIGAYGAPAVKSRRKFKGGKRERIRARRSEKLKAKKAELIESKTDVHKDEDEDLEVESPKKRIKVEKDHGDKTSKGSALKDDHKVFISSLFKYNPEIPKIEKANVIPTKEEVFSTGSFKELDLHPHLVSCLEERLKLTHMTRVQKLTIPEILAHKDVLVKSQTGSGKTLSFAIPIVQTLQQRQPKVKRSDGIYAIVIVPTRELARQCIQTFQDLVYPFQWIVPGILMGGEKRKAEKARLRKGINILVTTPGRLLDHVEHTSTMSLTNVQFVVLDEADRMLDLGYEKDIAKILTSINYSNEETKRQTVLLSATLSEGVERLAGISLNNPIHIDASITEEDGANSDKNMVTSSQTNFVVPEKLKQHFVITPCKLRLVTLAAFILSKCKYSSNPGKMIVFLSTQAVVEFHYRLFQHFFGSGDSEDTDEGFSSDDADLDIFQLHGGMQHKDRVTVYNSFCTASAGILFCTDVASRGLHLPHVRWIIQYTTPGVATEYIQRVGRTARAGKQGNSLLFLMPSEVEYIKTLQNHNIRMEEIQMADILKTLMVAVRDMISTSDLQRQQPRTYEESATYLQMCFETFICDHPKIHELAVKAYQSFVRGYATYPASLKAIFHVKHLHLGHLAKSYGLREAPTDVAGSRTKGDRSTGAAAKYTRQVKGNRATKDLDSKSKTSFSSLAVSEFSSGLNEGKVFKCVKMRKKKLK